jgi:5-methylcytosine-specific restriction endonuclease McrA
MIEFFKTTNRKSIDKLLNLGHARRCCYCYKKLEYEQMTLEHVCPTSCQPNKIPNNNINNLKIACAKCNNTKIPVCHKDCEFAPHNKTINNMPIILVFIFAILVIFIKSKL